MLGCSVPRKFPNFSRTSSTPKNTSAVGPRWARCLTREEHPLRKVRGAPDSKWIQICAFPSEHNCPSAYINIQKPTGFNTAAIQLMGGRKKSQLERDHVAFHAFVGHARRGIEPPRVLRDGCVCADSGWHRLPEADIDLFVQHQEMRSARTTTLL